MDDTDVGATKLPFISISNGFADMLRPSCQVNDSLGGDLQVGHTSTLLIEEAILHPISQETHNLLLNHPVTFELGVGFFPKILMM